MMTDFEKNINFEGWKKSMTDYQFKHLMELIEKVNRLKHESEALYQLVKSHVESGKSPEEILAAVESLRKSNT